MISNDCLTTFNAREAAMFKDFSDLLTVDEVMLLLGIGKNSAYKLFRSGKIRAFRLNGKWKIRKQSVINFINSQET